MELFGYSVMTWQWGLLGAVTLFFIWFSWWASLKDRRFHGVWRFFSFESILILVVFNARFWFRDPWSPRQWVSWGLLAGSIFFAAWGFYFLYKHGRPEGKMEATTRLVEAGLYRYVRHPLYSSLLLGGTGAFLKHVSWPTAILALINALALYLTARWEEGEMKARFGSEYGEYMKRTKMFLPWIF